MTSTGEGPIQRLGRTLVVREGGARILWQRFRTRGWQAEDLWPRPDDVADLGAHVARRDPLLVIFEHQHAVVPVFAEEMLLAQPALRLHAKFGDAPGMEDDDIGEIDVPFLDWLPGHLRERGVRFAAASEGLLSGPRWLRPTVLLDKPYETLPHIRFARLMRPVTLSPTDVATLADHAFRGHGDKEESAYSSCPLLHRVTESC